MGGKERYKGERNEYPSLAFLGCAFVLRDLGPGLQGRARQTLARNVLAYDDVVTPYDCAHTTQCSS